MSFRRLAVALTAATLGMGLAAACGDSEGSRENVERGNQGNTGDAGAVTVETGPTTIGSTGEDQPQVTQEQTTP
jgi:hypothetical protein